MVKVLSWGHYVPKKVLTNEQLSQQIDTSDRWIRSRTGIEQRRIAAQDELTSDLAYQAAKECLANAKVLPEQVDAIILATMSPDRLFPATATIVQHKLGAVNAFSYDIATACSGFVFAWQAGVDLIKRGGARKVLVIGAEVLSRTVNWQDRNTCVLFGDGAGAVLLSEGNQTNVLAECFITKPNLEILYSKGTFPITQEGVDNKEYLLYMDGPQVFEQAIQLIVELLNKVQAKCKTPIDFIVPHQANYRIIKEVAYETDIPIDKFLMNLNKYGNTSAASIPIAVVEHLHLIKPGDVVCLVGFGAGMTGGSVVINW